MLGQSPLAAAPFAALYGNTVYAGVSEGATGSDVSTRIAIYSGSLSELAAGLDASTNIASFFASLDEGVSGSDEYVAGTIFHVSVSESAQGDEAYVVVKSTTANVTGIQLYAIVGNALVWGVIDDTQDAGWTIIPT